MFYLQYWFYKKYLKRLFFIVCIMFMFICTALAVIQLLHVSLGSHKSFQNLATPVLFSVINVCLWCYVFKQINLMMMIEYQLTSWVITCSTVVLQCYRRQAIPMEQAKIRPSVTFYSLHRSSPNLVWLITSATFTQMLVLVKFGWVGNSPQIGEI